MTVFKLLFRYILFRQSWFRVMTGLVLLCTVTFCVQSLYCAPSLNDPSVKSLSEVSLERARLQFAQMYEQKKDEAFKNVRIQAGRAQRKIMRDLKKLNGAECMKTVYGSDFNKEGYCVKKQEILASQQAISRAIGKMESGFFDEIKTGKFFDGKSRYTVKEPDYEAMAHSTLKCN